jgi:hypothetical protein
MLITIDNCFLLQGLVRKTVPDTYQLIADGHFRRLSGANPENQVHSAGWFSFPFWIQNTRFQILVPWPRTQDIFSQYLQPVWSLIRGLTSYVHREKGVLSTLISLLVSIGPVGLLFSFLLHWPPPLSNWPQSLCWESDLVYNNWTIGTRTSHPLKNMDPDTRICNPELLAFRKSSTSLSRQSWPASRAPLLTYLNRQLKCCLNKRLLNKIVRHANCVRGRVVLSCSYGYTCVHLLTYLDSFTKDDI